MKVAIFISGAGSNMVALINSMKEPNYPYEPALVISDKLEALGIDKAKKLNIPVIIIESYINSHINCNFEEQIFKALELYKIEVICLAGFMRILTANFISKFPGKIINIHPSLLPSLKGTNTHQRAIDMRLDFHGATVHEVTENLDSGKILGQISIPVYSDDTRQSLESKVRAQEHILYPRVLSDLLRPNKLPIQIIV